MEGKAVEFGEEASISGDSVGDRLFSLTADVGGVYAGITYRQWLIGQALAGTSADGSMNAVRSAEWAIKAADAVIAQIDTESARDTRTTDLFEPEHQCCGGCFEPEHQCCGGCK